jgi:hypothetical protein
VEARVEMDLSRATRFALRFEDELCEGHNEVIDFEPPPFAADESSRCSPASTRSWRRPNALSSGGSPSCARPIVVGGRGSWIEVHGEDKRVDMGKFAVQDKHETRASEGGQDDRRALSEVQVDAQPTLIEHDKQKAQLVQTATDLAFIEDQARRNNMELWLEYTVQADPLTGKIGDVDILIKFFTSPERNQQLGAVDYARLKGDEKKTLRLHPDPSGEPCANITKFDARVDFDKPTSVSGFAMSDDKKREAMKQVAEKSYPVDAEKDAVLKKQLGGRKLVAPPAQTDLESYLAVERILTEQSWFVEVDCSASTSTLGYVVRPHMTIPVEGVGKEPVGRLPSEVATHVFNATDNLVDFTLRANGFKGDSNA